MSVDEDARVAPPMTDLPVIKCCTPLAGSSLGDEQAVELEAVMKALADRHRLRIVNLLLRADGEPVCVCEIAAVARPLAGHRQPPPEAAGRGRPGRARERAAPTATSASSRARSTRCARSSPPRPPAAEDHGADAPTSLRRAAAEAIGAFALVFAGCGAIVTDAEHPGTLGAVGDRARLRPGDHGDGLRDRPPLRRPPQPGGDARLRPHPPLPRRARRSPTSPPSCSARSPRRRCCSRSGRASRRRSARPLPTRRRRQRPRLRGGADRLPDVRDHGRGHRHPRGRRRRRRSRSAARSASTPSSAARSPAPR